MIQPSDPVENAELIAFTRAVEAKSLSRAAAELGVPRATLGRRLARLEERLGARLLRRTTRSLAVTDAGETFYRHARLVLEAVAQAQDSVRKGDGAMRGDVRVSVPPNMDESFHEWVTGFALRHPDVRVLVDSSSRLVDLRRDGYDVALRASAAIEPGLIARPISRHKVIAVASPDYLARYGAPKSARDLKKHRCLTGFARGDLPLSSWPAGRGFVHVDASFASNDLGVLRTAAARGLGIALLPMVMIADLLASGQLVQVLGGVVETENRIAVVYVERDLLPSHVRAFVEELVKWAPSLARSLERAAPRRAPVTDRARPARAARRVGSERAAQARVAR